MGGYCFRVVGCLGGEFAGEFAEGRFSFVDAEVAGLVEGGEGVSYAS